MTSPINEKDLWPGRILTHREAVWSNKGLYDVITAWLVVGHVRDVERRHAKNVAKTKKWTVIMLEIGTCRLQRFTFHKDKFSGWKRVQGC